MFDFTQEEHKVILFLVTIALIGIAGNSLVKRFSAGKTIAYFSQDLGKIDLNSADKKLLMGVSGIGERLAERIIEYREKREGFNNMDELKDIKGISESKFMKIKEYLIIK